MSRLSVRDPELVRVTWPSIALSGFGQALQHHFQGDLFKCSFPTKRIQCFWSHSWHANAWQKILLLMVIYNGRAALVLGSIAALLVQPLVFMSFLPLYRRTLYEGITYDLAPWGLISGCLVGCLVLVFWQNSKSQQIFLDRICIHQKDPQKKTAGIQNIGAFLKCSESMLVLWDPTYTSRREQGALWETPSTPIS
eukprot:Skav217994  [mRNA]  locus=scaffold3329:277276:277860:- [translate_table: standard]